MSFAFWWRGVSATQFSGGFPVIDFVGKRGLFFLISAILIIPGLISMALPGGFNVGIDFSSGSTLTLRFVQPVEQGDLRQALADYGHPEAVVQRSDDVFLVRTFPLAAEVRGPDGELTQQSERFTLEQQLNQRFGSLEVLTFDSVSPLLAAEVVQKSILAVLAACLGIMLYLWFAFRSVDRPWRYGACAVAALIHDAILLIGTFSLIGRFFPFEFDALFITATLTVIGFSVHDTIVVFDRVRENLMRAPGAPFEEVVNHALSQTLVRSLGTSITTLLVMVALLLFGGVTIRPFVLALVIGVVSGTYSSIFNASMLLVVWENGELTRVFRRRPAVEPSRVPA
jgi:preprotein translocase subunit SecF